MSKTMSMVLGGGLFLLSYLFSLDFKNPGKNGRAHFRGLLLLAAFLLFHVNSFGTLRQEAAVRRLTRAMDRAAGAQSAVLLHTPTGGSVRIEDPQRLQLLKERFLQIEEQFPPGFQQLNDEDLGTEVYRLHFYSGEELLLTQRVYAAQVDIRYLPPDNEYPYHYQINYRMSDRVRDGSATQPPLEQQEGISYAMRADRFPELELRPDMSLLAELLTHESQHTQTPVEEETP